jgi:NAD(P)-dependent dehydrogenase (short-subunit alcohol dehydrogenase family)
VTYLNDKVVVITGALGSLGKVFTEKLLAQSAVVIATDIDSNAIAKCNNTNENNMLEYMVLDITSEESIRAVFTRVIAQYGKISAIVNNAYPRNSHYGSKLEDVTFDSFCENTNLHLGGYFLVMQEASKFFITQGFGNTINIASIYGVITPKFEIYEETQMTMPVEYAVIKSSIIQLTKYFAKYHRKKGLRYNSISPGGILANQPLAFRNKYEAHCNSKGLLDADDVAGALLFLISDDSKYITGQNITVDDGFIL